MRSWWKRSSTPRERAHYSTPFTRLTTDSYSLIVLLAEGGFLGAGEVGAEVHLIFYFLSVLESCSTMLFSVRIISNKYTVSIFDIGNWAFLAIGFPCNSLH